MSHKTKLWRPMVLMGRRKKCVRGREIKGTTAADQTIKVLDGMTVEGVEDRDGNKRNLQVEERMVSIGKKKRKDPKEG